MLDERLETVGRGIGVLLERRRARGDVLPAEQICRAARDAAVELHRQALIRAVDDGDAARLRRDFRADVRDFLVHRGNQDLALLALARDLGECADLCLDIVVALHVEHERLDAVLLQGTDELLVHALVEDDEVRLAGEDLLDVDLVDLADTRLVLRVVGHLRLRVGSADDIAADFMQRLEEGRRRHDDALRLLRKLDIAAHGIMDHGKWRRTRRRRRLLRPTAAREHGERQKAHECA